MRGLYIHIPFCKHICAYCDFPKMVTFKYEKMKEYVNYLSRELLSYKDKYLDIETIFIGGGTPNALPLDLLTSLLETVDIFKEGLNIKEYSIECNPELITKEQVNLFVKHKINRVSLGVESFDTDILKKLGRHHTKDDVIRSVNLLKEYNINNINIDLIFAHPYDSINLVKYNLEEFYKLAIPHISYYSMILEDKTIFNYMYEHDKIKLLDEDTSASLYEYIISDLEKNGYKQYEISNFSKKRESIHNKLYWQTKEYLGVGLSASSYLNSTRFTNAYNLNDYYKGIKVDVQKLNELDKEKEFMLMGFRMLKVSKKEFELRFDKKIEDVFSKEILNLKNEGLIIEDDNYYILTHEGLMLANRVFMEFV